MTSGLSTFTEPVLLGQGGMARVYRATHRATAIEVALKCLPADATPARREAFHRELRAVARIEHPHVLDVLASGEAEAGDPLPLGTVWMASPLARSSLADRPPRTFDEVRDVVRAVASALGVVHAHGILHRDLTPGNVLDTGTADLPHWRLADFGLARLEGRALRGGTPGFHSPEQVTGGREGPATDLYALGCLTWWMVNGAPPAEAPWRPRIAVPAGLEAWLDRLLAASPLDRIGHARAALLAFEALGDPESAAEAHAFASRARESRTTWTGDDGTDEADEWAPTPEPAGELDLPLPEHWTALVGFDPRTPLTWGQRSRIASDPGLALLREREPPLVERTAVCDALWEELRGFAHARRSRVVRLVGDRGVGSSRLLRWFGVVAGASGAVATDGRAGAPLRLLLLDRDDPRDPVALVREASDPVLVVAVGPGPADRVLEVPRLSEGGCRALHVALGGTAMLAEIVRWWCDGLPRELLAIFDRVHRPEVAGTWTAAIPPDEAHAARVAAWPEEEVRRVARAWVRGAAGGGHGLSDRAELAAGGRWLEPGLASACYAALPWVERARLHAELAAGGEGPTWSVLHTFLGGDWRAAAERDPSIVGSLPGPFVRTLPEEEQQALARATRAGAEGADLPARDARLARWMAVFRVALPPAARVDLARRALEEGGPASVWRGLGVVLVQVGRPDEGAEALREGFRLHPDAHALGVLAAWALRMGGRHAEAAALLDQLPEARGAFASCLSWLERGHARWARGDLAGAEEAFLRSLAHQWRVDAAISVALLRLEQGRLADAVALAREAANLPTASPHTARAAALQVEWLAALYGGSLRDARRCFETLDATIRQFRLRDADFARLGSKGAARLEAAGLRADAERVRAAIAGWVDASGAERGR